MPEAPELDNVLVEVSDGVATVVLNRPEQRNSLSSGMLRDLHSALTWCRETDEARVLVLTGAGDRAFCARADLRLVDLFLLFEDLGKPVVGRINGHALAGGLGLACACDLLLAVDGAAFATPEIKVGLWPAMIQALLARNLPRKLFLEMVMLGDRWTAAQMKEAGLVNRVLGSLPELDAATAEVAGSLAATSPLVMRLGRDSFYRQQDMEFRAALEYLRSQLTLVSLSEDTREGIAAFFEKRDPEFKGR